MQALKTGVEEEESTGIFEGSSLEIIRSAFTAATAFAAAEAPAAHVVQVGAAAARAPSWAARVIAP